MKDESSDRAELTFDPSKRNVFVRVAFLGTPLYERPDEAAQKVAYLNQGTPLQVLGENQEFLHVQTVSGVTGYVRRSAAPSV